MLLETQATITKKHKTTLDVLSSDRIYASTHSMDRERRRGMVSCVIGSAG